MTEHRPTETRAESSHTSGPWLLNADAKLHEPGFYGTPNQPGEEEVYTSINIGESVRLAGFIRPADARLIAAAPDLLEVVRQVVTHVNPQGPYSEIFDSALAAITKAEGL